MKRHLLGRSERVAGAIAETIKIHRLEVRSQEATGTAAVNALEAFINKVEA